MSKKQITGIVMILVLIVIYFGVKFYASNVAEKKVNEAIAKAANFVDIDYKKVSVGLLDMDVRVSDIVITPEGSKEKIKIAEAIIRDIDDKANIPSFLSASLKGIEVDLNSLGDHAKTLNELGYSNKLLFYFNIDYNYEKEKQKLNIRKLALGAKDVGEITISLHLGNINLDPTEIMGLLFFTYPQIILYEAKINYKDESLAERLFKLGARENNKDLKEFKKSLTQKIEKEIEREKGELNKKALVAVKKFIDNPEKFSILVSPSKPLPFERIMRTNDAGDLIKLLNIQIES